jgi:two-component system, cell cycle response regulator
MSPAIRVALIGFTPFEARHITGLLAHGDPARPTYRVCDEMAGSSVVICNADDEAAAAAVQREGRTGACVMLGARDRPGAAAQLPRPIRPLQLLRTLQSVSLATPAMSHDVRRAQDELARIRTRPMALEPASRRAALDHVLVVDHDDHVLRFVTEQVQRFGFQVHLARGGEEGLRRAAARRFEYVFLAAGLPYADAFDAFQACKAIKAAARPQRKRPPCVVVLLEQEAAGERLRAQLAGADACLVKPLEAQAVLRVFGAREVASVAYADTADASNTQV